MNTKKIFAVILALVMVFAMTAGAFAADEATLNDDGEAGAFAAPDTAVSQSKQLILTKVLRAFNESEAEIHAPTISYVYTITAVTPAEGTTVTDGADKHDPAGTVTAQVKAGIVPSGGFSTITVSWDTTETLAAADDGADNEKTFVLDFSNVVFTGAGIYRYAITETLASGFTYESSGVTEAQFDADHKASHTRYIDVYVRPNPADGVLDDNDETNDWDIYGYTCFVNDTSITEENKTTAAVKTTGFTEYTALVNRALTETLYLPDSYYTFNVEIDKTVVNDAYAAKNHEFPFTVLFTNEAITKEVKIDATATKATGFIDPAASALSGGAVKGIVSIKDGGSIKYYGIPCGTGVEVYETNDVKGVTYLVTTSVTGVTDPTVENVTDGSTPTTATAQAATKPAYQSTKTTIATTADADEENDYVIGVTNKLLNISPTGVALRYAPYLLILFGGIVLLILGRKWMRRLQKDEKTA